MESQTILFTEYNTVRRTNGPNHESEDVMRVNKTRLCRRSETQSAPSRTVGIETPHRAGRCERCGGFLVDEEVSLDTMSTERRSTVWAMRCVQCGDLIDETILRNRYFPHYVLQEDNGEFVTYSEEELPCIR